MIDFLLKHKAQLLFWVPFIVFGFVLFPQQESYYFENDVHKLRLEKLYPLLKLICAAIFLTSLIYFLRKYKAVKLIIVPSLLVAGYAALAMFLFRGWITDFALLVNRSSKVGVVNKGYVANFLATANDTKENFYPYDIQEKNTVNNTTIRNLLYNESIKRDDTVYLQLNKGVFGISFHTQKIR
jgi:hypothetical protein